MSHEVVVLITAANQEEAAQIGTTLVHERLAACVNIVPAVRSLFIWKGTMQDEQETLLLVKSRRPLMEQLAARVKSLHSYTVPEVIALPIVSGSEEYLTWLNESTKP